MSCNLTDILKRNDLKKSDAYQSGFLEGTVPTYEAYVSLKKSINLALNKEGGRMNYLACIAEGTTETAIIDVLMDHY